MVTLIFYGLFILLLLLGLLWILVPALYGLPSIPTRPDRIRKALKLANLQPNEILYDLGAGDGRVLRIAAREFGARGVGIEIDPMHCAFTWLIALASGLGDQVQIRWQNFYKADLSEADIVFFYGTSKETARLGPKLARELKQGARVAAISADFPNWQPSAFDYEGLIFIYRMPPIKGDLASYLLEKEK